MSRNVGVPVPLEFSPDLAVRPEIGFESSESFSIALRGCESTELAEVSFIHYRRYAIVDETMLKEGAAKLQVRHETQALATPVIGFPVPDKQFA